MNTWTCIYCGCQVEAGYEFCDNCGDDGLAALNNPDKDAYTIPHIVTYDGVLYQSTRTTNRKYWVGFRKSNYTYDPATQREVARTVEVICADDLDCLPADLWIYKGPRIVTKTALRKQRGELLAAINAEYNTSFTRIMVY